MNRLSFWKQNMHII